jgi:hypothetical protein
MFDSWYVLQVIFAHYIFSYISYQIMEKINIYFLKETVAQSAHIEIALCTCMCDIGIFFLIKEIVSSLTGLFG